MVERYSKRVGGLIMAREEAKEMLPIIQAFADGTPFGIKEEE